MRYCGGKAAFQLRSCPEAIHRFGSSPEYSSSRMRSFGHSKTSMMSSIARAKYGWIGGVERLESYEVGGYHPVMVDEIIHNRYRIVDKLGYGGYSTVWLARDQRLHRYVALKIGTADSKLARHEVATLRVLADATISSFSACDLVPKIHDDFDIIGPNGSHTCYTVDPAQGNLKEAKYSRLFPIAVARALAAKLALAVSLVHSRGFCHGGEFLLIQLNARISDECV